MGGVAAQISNLQCVVVGMGQDFPAGEKIAAMSGALNLCGKLDLTELVALVRGAVFVLANESGIAHMAAYFHVPSIAVLGGGHYDWFMPYPSGWPELTAPRAVYRKLNCFGCNWQCRYQVAPGAPVPCIEQVSVDDVRREVRSLWDDVR
jgi:ADP-heptose:LPS heptosyltransferase